MFLLAFASTLLSDCAVKKRTVYEKEGRKYGKTEGLFKGKWNDYYLRGISYNDGGYWHDAIPDFQEAIHRRDKDKRRARTYGLHFIDYFPNRELGIAYYNIGKYPEAIQALEASLTAFPTARAKYYINKARTQWLKETRTDTAPPTIEVQFPPPVYSTNTFSIRIKGRATDNFFVSSMIFNDKAAPLELAQKEISFEEEVPLRYGENIIMVQAKDLLEGTSAPVTLKIKVDREGPLLALEGKKEGGAAVIISGGLYDESGIAKVSFNGKDVTCKNNKFQKIEERIPLALASGSNNITCVAEDTIGNKTTAFIALSSREAGYPPAYQQMIAFAGSNDSWPPFSGMTLPSVERPHKIAAAEPAAGASSARIDFKGLREGQTVLLDSLFVEGSAYSPAGIKDITVNGDSFLGAEQDESLAAFLKELAQKRKSSLSFSKLIKLQEGPNTITIKLIDAAGKELSRTIQVISKVPKARQVGSRLTLTIYPFKEKKGSGEPIADYVQRFLSSAFVNQKRFNILERQELNKLLEEQRLSQEDIFNQDTAVKLGRMMAAEGIILGDIIATEGSVEIVGRMVDTETSLILAEKDVYWEGQIRAGFKDTLAGLALKFAQQFPLCEGSVINSKAKEVLFNLGSENAICPGMKFLAFRETNPVIDPDTGQSLGTDTEVLGVLSAKEIHEKFTKGTVVKTLAGKEIAAKDKVITK